MSTPTTTIVYENTIYLNKLDQTDAAIQNESNTHCANSHLNLQFK